MASHTVYLSAPGLPPTPIPELDGMKIVDAVVQKGKFNLLTDDGSAFVLSKDREITEFTSHHPITKFGLVGSMPVALTEKDGLYMYGTHSFIELSKEVIGIVTTGHGEVQMSKDDKDSIFFEFNGEKYGPIVEITPEWKFEGATIGCESETFCLRKGKEIKIIITDNEKNTFRVIDQAPIPKEPLRVTNLWGSCFLFAFCEGISYVCQCDWIGSCWKSFSDFSDVFRDIPDSEIVDVSWKDGGATYASVILKDGICSLTSTYWDKKECVDIIVNSTEGEDIRSKVKRCFCHKGYVVWSC